MLQRLLLYSIALVLCASVTVIHTQELEKGGEENPNKRYEDFIKQRAFPNDYIPDGAYQRAREKAELMSNRKGASALMAVQPQWRLLGPDNIGGRTRSVAHHPTKDGWVYVAAAGGGVWRTTNHGKSWEPISDQLSTICMGAIAIDPNNPDVLYAGTGEFRPAAPNHQDGLGSGMYKSTDAGKTWVFSGLSAVQGFSKVYVHPKNSNLIYAGGIGAGHGLYRSTDAGKSWLRTNRLTISDVTLNPSDEKELWIGVSGSGIFHTTDGGDNWTKVNGTGNNVLPDALGRISVQCCAAQPNVLYTLLEGPDPNSTATNVGYVYKSTDGGGNWVVLLNARTEIFNVAGNPQGDYDNYIAVHPTNPNVAIAGGIDIFMTQTGNSQWDNITNSYSGGPVHPDQQAAMFNPLNPSEIYCANDGGMYRYVYSESGANWEDINNGYSVTAFYAMDIDRSAENKTYGGTQDNGTLGSVQQKVGWDGVMGGDGFYTVVNSANPNVVYAETSGGAMRWVNVQTRSGGSLMQGILSNDTADWSAPIIGDYDNSTVYHGRKRLYAMQMGGNKWDLFSPVFDAGTTVSAIGPCTINTDIVWAGLQNGGVFRTSNGGENWKNVSFNGLPKRWVRDVMASRKNDKTAWVCYSGYGTGHIFKTTDLGETWTDVSTTLPDVPVNAIIIYNENENIMFAGTDVGVFATFNGGTSWTPFGRGLPHSPVMDMALFEDKGKLRIATHGRSMWEIDIPTEAVDEPEITSPIGGEVVMATSSMVFSWHGFSGPVNIDITFSNGQYWTPLARNLAGSSMRWVVENRPTEYARIRVTEANNPNISLVSNNFTILEFQKGSVQTTTSVSHVAYGLAYDGNNGLYTTSFYTNKLYKLNATTMQIEKDIDMPAQFDKNYTDMGYDKSTGNLFIHRLTNVNNNNSPSQVVVVDTNGKLVRQMSSPAIYGTGIEIINGKLHIVERGGEQYIYVCDPGNTTNIQKQVANPFKVFYGPRCIAYNEKENYIYEVGTEFAASGGDLLGAYLIRIRPEDLGKEVARMELINGSGSTINARGIEVDPRDGNYWITDLAGNIYKIANFETPSNPLSDVNDTKQQEASGIIVSPNPVVNQTVIGFMTGKVEAHVTLEVYNLIGERVAQLVNGTVSADDNHAVLFDCSTLPNGVYTISLIVDGISRPAEKFIISR